MELNPQVAYYVIHFHADLMTDAERKAQRHLFATMKATMGRSDETAQREAQHDKIHSRVLSSEPNVLSLVKVVISNSNSRPLHVFLEIPLIKCPSTFVPLAGSWRVPLQQNSVVTADMIGMERSCCNILIALRIPGKRMEGTRL
jgi:hypothetical protein